MKGTLLLLSMLSTLATTAQTGIINYKRTITFGNINIEGGVPESLAAMLPKEHSDQQIMYFTPDASLYENNPEAAREAPEGIEGDGIQIQIESGSSEEKYYTDLKNQRTIQQKDFMGRQFLIKEELKKKKWKITGNQKKILGYAAMEATLITDKDTITAWYTTELPVSAGPEGVNGLPGLVLETAINKNMTIVATSVKMDNAAASKIKEPVKGKKLTAEEYEKLVKQKEAEMEQEMGAGGGRQIMIIK